MHIYQISRLYQKPADTWERILKDLEKSRDFMPKQYSTLRQALVAETQNFGTGRKLLEQGLALPNQAPNHETICKTAGRLTKTTSQKYFPTYKVSTHPTFPTRAPRPSP